MQEFRLVPFSKSTKPNITIQGEAIRSNNDLFLRYEVNGDIDQILLSARASSPSRTEDLWKASCFEFFLAIPNRPEYWEFNMSPSGDWNVYKMDAYRRRGFREEDSFSKLPFMLRETHNELSLEITVDLDPILQPRQKVQIGVSAIIQTVDGGESYWALAHPGNQADFHLRDGFILLL